MIKLLNNSNEKPYKIFIKKYEEAILLNQKNIEAICISSFSKNLNEVNSRFVNLKMLDNKKFIFFSNYNSPKSREFNEHNQITALFFWNSTNIQIRMKGFIEKTSKEFNDEFFLGRSNKKNALALSSNQSELIDSYESVKKKYNNMLKSGNLKKCPDYWGGYYFLPFYFEFWEGHDSRLNKREVFELVEGEWNEYILEP